MATEIRQKPIFSYRLVRAKSGEALVEFCACTARFEARAFQASVTDGESMRFGERN